MIVLDTNVVSELMRPNPSSRVVEWVAQQAVTNLYLSTVSEAELRYGVEILPAGQRRDRLLAEVEGMLRETLLVGCSPLTATLPKPTHGLPLDAAPQVVPSTTPIAR